MLRIAFIFAVLIVAARPNAAAAEDAQPRQQAIQFGHQILPILSGHCFQCHGPDARQRQADLRLDEEASAKQARDGGAAIVPGKSEASEVFRRIVSPDPDERMPPEEANRPLSADQIALVKRWIDEGAV
ncbi:MAG: c-type cytochrome domain-containing protein, partial [Pirellulales bacterium]